MSVVIKLRARREWTEARRPKSERRPTWGEIWTCQGIPFECFDANPDPEGRFGWKLNSGTKLYTTAAGLTPPKAKRQP